MQSGRIVLSGDVEDVLEAYRTLDDQAGQRPSTSVAGLSLGE
jgi:hypothetical protein